MSRDRGFSLAANYQSWSLRRRSILFSLLRLVLPVATLLKILMTVTAVTAVICILVVNYFSRLGGQSQLIITC